MYIKGIAVVVVVDLEIVLKLQEPVVIPGGAMLVARRCLADHMKVNTATRPSVAFITSPIHSEDVDNGGKRELEEDRREEGSESLSGRTWVWRGAGGRAGIEGRSGIVLSKSDCGSITLLEGNCDGSTSLPGIGDERRGLFVAPNITSLNADLAEWEPRKR
jgi:hypothetical protein